MARGKITTFNRSQRSINELLLFFWRLCEGFYLLSDIVVVVHF